MAEEWSPFEAPAQPDAAGESWRVLILNDDKTPFEFVIDTLEAVFMLSEEIADYIALTAHEQGAAVVVIRSRAAAEALASVARARAQAAGYPLAFSLEADARADPF